jgi:hypothetical protein
MAKYRKKPVVIEATQWSAILLRNKALAALVRLAEGEGETALIAAETLLDLSEGRR